MNLVQKSTIHEFGVLSIIISLAWNISCVVCIQLELLIGTKYCIVHLFSNFLTIPPNWDYS